MLLNVCRCVAQAAPAEFQPALEDQSYLTGLRTTYEAQYRTELHALSTPYKKDYQELYDARWATIRLVFDNAEVYTLPAAQAYLDRLVAEIIKGNPGLKEHPFHCYFSRSYIPNAASIGEDIILFNMGLFYRLTDESQAAFILCHEIAHCVLQHQQKSIDKYVTAINSAAVQAELRSIKGSEYRKRERLEQLVKGLSFDSRRHSRDHEAEADSMGLALLSHTGFDVSGALTTLALLDGIDKDVFDTESSLRRTFNSAAYPFRNKWVAVEGGLLGGHARVEEDKELRDSLKTHPDCQKRILLIRPMVGPRNGTGRRFMDSAAFVRWQEAFHYEAIEYAYTSKKYTESLFLTLEWQQSRPKDTYLISQAGRVLNGLYAAQKAHRLSEVADLPGPAYPENYNLLLQFVQNLYLEDLASISYYYLKGYHPQLDHYASFKSVFEESQHNANPNTK